MALLTKAKEKLALGHKLRLASCLTAPVLQKTSQTAGSAQGWLTKASKDMSFSNTTYTEV